MRMQAVLDSQMTSGCLSRTVAVLEHPPSLGVLARELQYVD